MRELKGIIRLGSVTYAMRAGRILEQNGIRSYIQKTTSKNGGCIYALEIQNGSLSEVEKIVTSAGIKILGS